MKLLGFMAAFGVAGYKVAQTMFVSGGIYGSPLGGTVDGDFASILAGVLVSLFPAVVAQILKYRPLLLWLHGFVGELLAQLPVPAPQPNVDPIKPVNPDQTLADAIKEILDILRQQKGPSSG